MSDKQNFKMQGLVLSTSQLVWSGLFLRKEVYEANTSKIQQQPQQEQQIAIKAIRSGKKRAVIQVTKW